MIRLLVRAATASAGGGLTYLRNVVPLLADKTDVQLVLLATPDVCNEFSSLSGVIFATAPKGRLGSSAIHLAEQIASHRLIHLHSVDLVLSTGNFALARCPVPQILLTRNALYTSRDFARDLRTRGDALLWLDTVWKSWLAKWSVQNADRVIAPSRAFAAEVEQWTGRHVDTIYHGFDSNKFFSDTTPLPHHVTEQLERSAGALKLLFVSHYNYYRNFETLFQALALAKKRLGRPVRLLLTCTLEPTANPGPYQTSRAACLVKKLGIEDDLVQLGAIPYAQLQHLYRACDLYVTPAYAETFAHPLMEAMASGLPVLASNIPVHREICDRVALYFPAFSAAELADLIVKLAGASDLRRRLREYGLERAAEFSWKRHVDELIAVGKTMVGCERNLATNRLSPAA